MLSKNGRGMPLQGAISGLPAWQGRSAGVYFCPGKNTRKTRLGLSPLGTPLGVRDWMCVKSMVGPGLVPVQENSYSLQRAQPDQSCAASPPGSMPVAMQPFPAAGTPLLQGRPGGGNHQAIGPAAQGGLVWWHKQEPQQGSRAEHQLDAVPAWYSKGGP